MGRFSARLLLNALLLFGVARAMPSRQPREEKPNGIPSKQMQEMLVRQLCSKKDIPDCENRAHECMNLTNAAQNGDGTTADTAKLCPGISTVDCYEKILQCSEILKPPVGEWSPQEAKTPRTTVQGGLQVEDPHSEGHGAKVSPEMNLQMQAMQMCSVSVMPNCEREVKACLKLAMMLKSSTDSEMMPTPDPSRCATTDIPDCEMKISKCQATMRTINENMKTQGSSMLSNKHDAKVAAGENVTIPPADSKPKVAAVKASSNMVPGNHSTMMEQGRNGTKTETKEEEEEEEEGEEEEGEEEDEEEEEETQTGKQSGGRRRRDDNGASIGRKGRGGKHGGGRGKKGGKGNHGHGSYHNHSHWQTAMMESNQLSSILLGLGENRGEKGGTIIVNFEDVMGGFENMIREIEHMMALVGAIMDQMDIAMDSTSNGERQPGILSLEEKGMFLTKFLCKGDPKTECKASVEKCAAWLAPSVYLSEDEDMESECANLVPASTSVGHNCADLTSEECQAEALSCMNLMIATGGTAGDVGPLTAHAEECEKMMQKILKTSACHAGRNETVCEMDIVDCMDTIRVEIDELYDHHSDEKLMCEPIMRPAIALYMCSQRNEPDCFSRMNGCLNTLSPERTDIDTTKSEEMLECLKLTKPPVSVICGREHSETCEKEYEACENLVTPNAIFIKAAQKCMHESKGEDEEIKKDCMRPAFKEVMDSMKDKGVQKTVTDLFENIWSPYMGLTGIHSCMMMVCSMEVTLKE